MHAKQYLMYYIMELRIKKILKNKGLKAVWLAKKIGVTDVNTRNIINGIVTPKMETLEKIAEALEVPMWQLFASPEEVIGDSTSSGNKFICPNCGAELEIRKKE